MMSMVSVMSQGRRTALLTGNVNTVAILRNNFVKLALNLS